MSTNHLSSFPLPSESVQSSCPYSLIIASNGLRRQGLRKPLTLFLFLAIIGAPRMDAFPPVFLWPQRVPQTLPGHMVTTGKRGHKTIYIPAESVGNVWKSIQIRVFNSFASERSRVRIPSGPPNKVRTNTYFFSGGFAVQCSLWSATEKRRLGEWSRDGAFLLSAHSLSAISPATMIAKINRRLYKFTFSLTLSAPVQQGQIF